MNVLVYCLSSISGGAVSYLRNVGPLLANHFENSSEGHTVKFLAHESHREWLEKIEGSRILWVDGARPTGYRRILWEMQNVPGCVRRESIDVVFTPYQVGPRVRGAVHVLMLRNMEPFLSCRYPYTIKSRVRNYLLRRASVRSLQQADRVIAVSEFAWDQLKNEIGIQGRRIRTIHHGRSEELHIRKNGQQDRAILARHGVGNDYILTCGSLLPYRRCEDVIAAFNRWASNSGGGAQLVIAGTGTDRRYRDLIRRAISASPYRDRILAVGHVPWETMVALYRHSLVCVLATEIEACPNIAIEAMGTGCAIVSCDRAPLPEMFRGCSLEFRARDIDDLVVQMRRLIDDKELRQRMKARALGRAEDFSWEQCARDTYSALVDWQDGRE